MSRAQTDLIWRAANEGCVRSPSVHDPAREACDASGNLLKSKSRERLICRNNAQIHQDAVANFSLSRIEQDARSPIMIVGPFVFPQPRYDLGVGNPQAFDAAYPKLLRDHRPRVRRVRYVRGSARQTQFGFASAFIGYATHSALIVRRSAGPVRSSDFQDEMSKSPTGAICPSSTSSTSRAMMTRPDDGMASS